MARRPECYKSLTAGLFYPDDKEALRQLIEKSLIPSQEEAPRLLYIPHGDYEYTLDHMARGYSLLKNREEPFRVVVMARVHREPSFRISVPLRKYFETPLGSFFIDRWQVKQIAENFDGTVREDIPFEEEHSIELQLPFLKVLFPKARVVPLLVGDDSPETLSLLKEVLAFLYREDPGAPWIISGNLSGVKEPGAVKNEAELFAALSRDCDSAGLVSTLRSGDNSACGAGCLATALSVLCREADISFKDSSFSQITVDGKSAAYGFISFA